MEATRLTEVFTSIGDSIREKGGTAELMRPADMPAAIAALPSVPEEALSIRGDCSYRFANGGWDWFIEQYGNRITTSNITNAGYMLSYSKVKDIPFDINIADKANIVSLFWNSGNLREIPYVKGMPASINNMFNGCYMLRNIPDDFGDFIDLSYTKIFENAQMSNMFNSCYSLRSIPQSLLSKLYHTKNTAVSRNPYYQMFNGCSCLDEVKNIPVQPITATSNFFYSTFDNCYRLADATFAVQEDGTPYTANWKSQVIDLSKHVGCADYYSLNNITGYNSGITEDKCVDTPESYNALKNDPDWFTKDNANYGENGKAYSRYNHDSAVNTINSLPDTSAYLASAGGTNTIKFLGAAGERTDGGAINTLTEEEIAVAAAKGWTVSLV